MFSEPIHHAPKHRAEWLHPSRCLGLTQRAPRNVAANDNRENGLSRRIERRSGAPFIDQLDALTVEATRIKSDSFNLLAHASRLSLFLKHRSIEWANLGTQTAPARDTAT